MLALMPFVRGHRVCWEIAPHLEARAGRLRHVGFDLTLHAQVPAGVDPGSEQAAAVHERLREIALQALPENARFDVLPFTASLHFRRETAWRAEVDLVVEIGAPSARAIGAALVRLGIPEGVYVKAA